MTKTMVYSQLVLTAIIWGGTFIAGRVVVRDIGAFSVAFLRFAVAAVCLLLMTYHSTGSWSKIKMHQLPGIALLGLSGVFAYNIFFFLGLQTITAGRAALIVALNPIAIHIRTIEVALERRVIRRCWASRM